MKFEQDRCYWLQNGTLIKIVDLEKGLALRYIDNTRFKGWVTHAVEGWGAIPTFDMLIKRKLSSLEVELL